MLNANGARLDGGVHGVLSSLQCCKLAHEPTYTDVNTRRDERTCTWCAKVRAWQASRMQPGRVRISSIPHRWYILLLAKSKALVRSAMPALGRVARWGEGGGCGPAYNYRDRNGRHKS